MCKRNRIPIVLSLCGLALIGSACGTASSDLPGQIADGDDLATAGPLTVEELAVRELRAPADDTTLYVRIAGDLGAENVLIAVNGGPGMSSDYMVSLEGLAGSELALVTYDQRGTGRSTKPAEGIPSYRLDNYVEDLEAVREAVGAEQVHVLGHSWGGVVAMRYATVYPERVGSMVLVVSGPPTQRDFTAGATSLRARIGKLQGERTIPKKLPSDGTKLARTILPAYFSDPNYEPPAELKDSPIDEVVNRLTWAALGNYDISEEVAKLEHQVLILWGEDDPFGLGMGEATRDALSNAQVEFVVLEDCGHFWQECPDDFYPRVRSFLELPSEP
jgi:pimeloyl-ACP methyl ester carboxylesterase